MTGNARGHEPAAPSLEDLLRADAAAVADDDIDDAPLDEDNPSAAEPD